MKVQRHKDCGGELSEYSATRCARCFTPDPKMELVEESACGFPRINDFPRVQVGGTDGVEYAHVTLSRSVRQARYLVELLLEGDLDPRKLKNVVIIGQLASVKMGSSTARILASQLIGAAEECDRRDRDMKARTREGATCDHVILRKAYPTYRFCPECGQRVAPLGF